VYFFVMAAVLFLSVEHISMRGPIVPHAVEALGKEMTFTGRTTLWSDLWPIALRRPLLGHGYGGFWVLGNESRPRKHSRHPPMSGHNGYLDVFLDMGILGVVIMALVILNSYMKISRSFATDFDYARLRLVLFLAILLHNICESSLCKLNNPLWVWFLFSAVSLPTFYTFEERLAFFSPPRGLPFFRKGHRVSARAP
jgi:O-antigen ligase